jgi:hypothetical protein
MALTLQWHVLQARCDDVSAVGELRCAVPPAPQAQLNDFAGGAYWFVLQHELQQRRYKFLG